MGLHDYSSGLRHLTESWGFDMITLMQSRCPETELRATLSDAEFWEYVFNRLLPGQEPFDEGPWDDGPAEFEGVPYIGTPCEVCGSSGACGYDDMGRPMIHTTEHDV